MSPAQTRNHYIPRVLLNRFCSRCEGNKYWVWQFTKDAFIKEISTRDVAVEKFFYGGSGSKVEQLLQKNESLFGSTLSQIDKGDHPKKHSAFLSFFIYTLAVRTRAIRSQFLKATQEFLGTLSNSACAETGKEKLKQKILNDLPQALQDQISRHPFIGLALKIYPQLKQQMLAMAELYLNKLPIDRLFQNYLELAVKNVRWEDAARNGQSHGLLKLLEQQKIPEWFYPKRWDLLTSKENPFVLGDSCAIVIGEEGMPGNLFRFFHAWQELYLPITPNRVIFISCSSAREPSLSEDKISTISVELSDNAFYAHKHDQHQKDLIKGIGEKNSLVNPSDLEDFARDCWF